MNLLSSAARYNLRFSLLPHILVGIGILLFTPFVFSITALDSLTAALPLELSLPFVGVALLTPVYAAEQDTGILSVVATRKTPDVKICLLRIVMALIIMFLLITGFVVLMAVLESEVFFAHVLGSCANAIFLGSLGVMASALSGNVVTGYMAPILYYVLDLMGGIMPFTLFSMMRSGTMQDKGMLFVVGIVCIAGSMAINAFRIKRS